MKTVLLIVIVLFIATACAAKYAVHRGAINTADSGAYDVLLIAEATIDQARLDLKSGQLPDTAKGAFNALVTAYNIARESWLTYRGALATNVPADTYFAQLNKNLTDLSGAIRALKEAR